MPDQNPYKPPKALPALPPQKKWTHRNTTLLFLAPTIGALLLSSLAYLLSSPDLFTVAIFGGLAAAFCISIILSQIFNDRRDGNFGTGVLWFLLFGLSQAFTLLGSLMVGCFLVIYTLR